MKTVTYGIYKQGNIWGLENVDHHNLIRSQHSKRSLALSALFKHYPHQESFNIGLPNIKRGFKFKVVIDRDTKERLWLVENRDYKSRARALSSFFARHTGITLFYVTIPLKGE